MYPARARWPLVDQSSSAEFGAIPDRSTPVLARHREYAAKLPQIVPIAPIGTKLATLGLRDSFPVFAVARGATAPVPRGHPQAD